MTNDNRKDFSIDGYIERKSLEAIEKQKKEALQEGEAAIATVSAPVKPRKKKKKNRVVSFILKWVPLVILGISLGYSAYTMNAEKIGGNAMPMPFGYGTSIVVSGSMSPAIEAGDCIIVKETKDVAVDDIIVFQNEMSAVVHRVKKIELIDRNNKKTSIKSTSDYIDRINNYKEGKLVDSKGNTISLTTKGDANNTLDASINLAQVKGKYIGRIRGIGTVLMVIKSPIGILIIIALIVLIFFLTNRIDKLEHKEEEDRLREEIEALKHSAK